MSKRLRRLLPRKEIASVKEAVALFDKLLRTATEPRCKGCGRLLTSPDSIRRGYGPTCLMNEWDRRTTWVKFTRSGKEH